VGYLYPIHTLQAHRTGVACREANKNGSVAEKTGEEEAKAAMPAGIELKYPYYYDECTDAVAR
jgi:hypothetical protein